MRRRISQKPFHFDKEKRYSDSIHTCIFECIGFPVHFTLSFGESPATTATKGNLLLFVARLPKKKKKKKLTLTFSAQIAGKYG